MASDRQPRRRLDERGETLVEIVLAIVVLSVVAVGAFSGLSTSSGISAQQRVNARNETVLRSAAEQIQSPDLAYVTRAGCSGVGSYSVPTLPSTPTGYTVSITAVTFWTGASSTPSASAALQFSTTCPATAALDHGLQKLTLRVTTPTGTTDVLEIVKRRP